MFAPRGSLLGRPRLRYRKKSSSASGSFLPSAAALSASMGSNASLFVSDVRRGAALSALFARRQVVLTHSGAYAGASLAVA
jgi:hypothetical protein